ncbi:NOC3p-domain-containing protein [Jaminaea rosea]|uniref:Nucleolar complex-associated protein 3 n=1 Tax=Jaminaea rosea TaxID=1569628 RepID=A0A316UQW8_9BASI|nr:NOC3p-domain-containing protein [Jaminaea rosea]PWN27699.1 NOC3p-domain-containing protein [Jaminaea rosea]
MEAEEMLAGSDDDDEGGDGSEEEVKAPATKKSNGKARATDAKGVDFLLNLDKKAISRSRAEEARLSKAERKAQRQEAGEDRSGPSSSRARLDEDSDAESTDMEGASESSDMGDDDSDDALAGIHASDEDFDSAQSFSDEESSSDDEDRGDKAERRHAEVLRARKRRERAEEANEVKDAKKRRLPVRGNEGRWQDEVGSDEDDHEGAAASAAAKKARKEENRVLREVRMAEASSSSEEEDEGEKEAAAQRRAQPASTITSGARFGLQAPYTIMLSRPKSARIAAAREQIARLSTDIIGDPEVSLGLLRRLSVFAQDHIQRPEHDSMAKEQGLPTKVEVDPAIRSAAILSLTAVFVDILPGYRIRALSDKEAAEKVNQETARRREWEQGLVEVYKIHLQACESVVRSKSPTVSSVALRSMCLLLTRATHFNFRTNLISSLVSQLSRKGWSDDSQQCAEALTEVLKRDLNGEVSLEVVRLLNRMIKERSYQVNAKVLNLLLHLRLKDELGRKRADTVRASDGDDKKNGDGDKQRRFQQGKGKAKPREIRKGQGQHLSKKAVKQLREVKEVEKEMKEAQAEVDVEERERNHTETLKLLFVLYFSILKAPAAPSPLLGAALEGLSRFAHRVNVEFFRDLLAVLRAHIEKARKAADGQQDVGDESEEDEEEEEAGAAADVELRRESHLRRALLCLVTAFELLSGQGEALIIDLSDLVNHLYALVLPVCTLPGIEEVPQDPVAQVAPPQQQQQNGGGRRGGAAFQSSTHLLRSTADLLLRSLDLALLRPRPSTLPSERSAAFIKRLLIAALQTPAQTSLRLLGVARSVMGRDVKLEALLDTEDRAKNGAFDVRKDDVEAARPLKAGEVVAWELGLLAQNVNEDVAEAARGILCWRKV